MLPSPELVVEIHVPLRPAVDLEPSEFPFAWIDDIEDYLAERAEDGDVEVYDDGEEIDEEYVFFVCGAPQEALVDIATEVMALPFVPAGGYAVVTDFAADVGTGRRVELPLP